MNIRASVWVELVWKQKTGNGPPKTFTATLQRCQNSHMRDDCFFSILWQLRTDSRHVKFFWNTTGVWQSRHAFVMLWSVSYQYASIWALCLLLYCSFCWIKIIFDCPLWDCCCLEYCMVKEPKPRQPSNHQISDAAQLLMERHNGTLWLLCRHPQIIEYVNIGLSHADLSLSTCISLCCELKVLLWRGKQSKLKASCDYIDIFMIQSIVLVWRLRNLLHGKRTWHSRCFVNRHHVWVWRM